MTPFIAELIGTAVMILLGGGVVANVVLKQTKGNNSGWIVITTAWAFAVFVGVTIAGPYSGAHLNPAVTLANYILGNISLQTTLSYVAAQFTGAMTGALLVWITYKDHFKQT
ncbi:MAG: aquaporin family protein, partial [Sphingobacterium sp.]|nr:aquaporin family protein [Sphingobacterium sp.]